MAKSRNNNHYESISRQQATIYHELKTALSSFSKSPAQLEESELKFVKRQAGKQYEIEQLVLTSQEAENVVIPDTLLNRALAEIRQRYETDEEYDQDLADNNLDEELLLVSLYRELKVEAVLDKVSSRVADVSDIDMRLYYFLHKEKFTQPESRVAYHVLITINDQLQENSRELSYKKISDIRKRVLNKPKRFQEQAAKHSECPTALNGGLIGNVARGQLFPELDEVLFALKQGEISDIVESEMGFHIIYCDTIFEDGPVEYKRAAQQIKEKLLSKRRKICQRTWLRSLTKSTDNPRRQ